MSILDQVSPAAPAMRGMTVVQARRALSEMFRRAGLDSPELDARLLTGHALGLDHTGLMIEAARPITDASPSRDLWPAVIAHSHEQARWTWLDLGLAAALLVGVALQPQWLWLLAYHF